MKVSVDPMACEANAICTGLAPDVFDLDDDDQLHVLLEEPPEDRHDAVRRAAAACPKQAITVTV